MRRLLRIINTTIALIFLSALTIKAQTRSSVNGVVTDANGEPLVGVCVIEDGTDNVVLTDVDGNYTINVLSSAFLSFDCMSFKQFKTSVSGRKKIDVVMEEDRTLIDEAVVVGYGTMKRSDLTGSVSSVSAKNLENFKTGNVLEALGGQVAGVNITSTDGTPGSGLNIIVRGVGTVNGDSSPLYIVDGFEVDDIAHISNQDIKSIEVLKDASASAIYGARAANGVVLVTTKSGKESKAVLSYSGSASYRTLANKLDVLSPYEFVKLQLEVDPVNSQKYFIPGVDDMGVPYKYQSVEDYKNVKGINWQDEAFQSTWSQNHDISLVGGSKDSKYAFSFSHFDEDGIFINSGYIKDSARAKLTQKITKWLDLDLNVSYTYQKKYGLGTGGWVLRNIIAYRPTGGLSVSDYELLNSPVDPEADNSFNNSFNPILATTKADLAKKWSTWTANGALTFKISKDLKLKTSGSFIQAFVRDDYFYYEGSEQAARSGGPYGQSTMQQNLRWSLNNVLTYNKTFEKKHKMTLMIGQEFQMVGSEYLRGQAKEFPVEDLGVNKLSVGNVASLVETSKSDRKRLSFFARSFYSYDNRYLITATVRADGSSVFAKGNRWGIFPSFAFAWNISNESWLKDKAWLDNLKLRVGYGTVGNDRISNFLSSEIYSFVKFGWGTTSTTALLPSHLANPDLRWEGATTINAGIDFSVLKERLSLTIDAFIKDTKDLLLQQNLSYVSGWESQWMNIGKIRNQGVEVSLKTININKRNFSWSTDFNISFIGNELLSLQDGTEYILARSGYDSNNTNYDYIARVGEPLGNMYGYVYAGVYQFSDFATAPDGTIKVKEGVPDMSSIYGSNFGPGCAKYKDINGDGIITTADRTIIGNGYADWYGGFTNTFHIHGFDFSFMFQYSYGNDVYNVTRYLANKTWYTGLNMSSEALDRWKVDNASNKVPSIRGMREHDIYSRFIEDGSYIRLKNATIGYTFPSVLMNRIKVNKLRLFVTAGNLFCLTKYSGYDPEVNYKAGSSQAALMPGMDYGSYPKNRSCTIGLEVTF